MSDKIECGLAVAKITVAETNGQTVTVVLKGQKTIAHNENGYDLEDIVDVEVKLKCSMVKTIQRLGVEHFLNTKILDLRDRDESLSGYTPALPDAMREKMV